MVVLSHAHTACNGRPQGPQKDRFEEFAVTTTIKLPELGENVDSGELTKILVSAGDRVSKDQALLELETDKATIEVPSPVAGTIKELHV